MPVKMQPRLLDTASRSVPADNVCAVCGTDVDLSKKNYHVCVYDAVTKKWSPSTAKDANKARLDRAPRP